MDINEEGHRQKVFDHGEGMIRQGDGAQANYRRSETLPLGAKWRVNWRLLRWHGMLSIISSQITKYMSIHRGMVKYVKLPAVSQTREWIMGRWFNSLPWPDTLFGSRSPNNDWERK